jgi:hypothetical protein
MANLSGPVCYALHLGSIYFSSLPCQAVLMRVHALQFCTASFPNDSGLTSTMCAWWKRLSASKLAALCCVFLSGNCALIMLKVHRSSAVYILVSHPCSPQRPQGFAPGLNRLVKTWQ